MMSKSITGGYYKSVNNRAGKEKSLKTNRLLRTRQQNIPVYIIEYRYEKKNATVNVAFFPVLWYDSNTLYKKQVVFSIGKYKKDEYADKKDRVKKENVCRNAADKLSEQWHENDKCGSSQAHGNKKDKHGAAHRTKKETQSMLQTSQVWNNVTVGIGLLILAVILVLALCQMDGVLLTGLLHLVGGLIGWGTKAFLVALCVGGMIALCDMRPVRLRVMSVFLLPVLWSALMQTVLVNPRMTMSITSIMELWHNGQSLHMGGVIGGMLSSMMVFLLSGMGAKIVLIIVMAFLLLVVFNTTPARIWIRLRNVLYEDVEQLREQDMTVTPADLHTEELEDEDSTQLLGQTSLLGRLRNQRGSRRKARLMKQQEQAERTEEQQRTNDLSGGMIENEAFDQAREEAAAASRAKYEKKMDNRRRLAEVMPDLTETLHTPESKQTVEPDVPPWGKSGRHSRAAGDSAGRKTCDKRGKTAGTSGNCPCAGHTGGRIPISAAQAAEKCTQNLQYRCSRRAARQRHTVS